MNRVTRKNQPWAQRSEPLSSSLVAAREGTVGELHLQLELREASVDVLDVRMEDIELALLEHVQILLRRDSGQQHAFA